MSQVLLITPPFTQLNTPYPATAYLKGYLNTIDIKARQCDMGIELIDQLFSEKGLRDLFTNVTDINNNSANAKRVHALRDDYFKVIDAVINYLRYPKVEMAYTICNTDFLPRASRFDQLSDIEWAFGNMGVMDQAKLLCTLFLEDIGDFITEVVDPHFGFSKYAERLARSASSFDDLDNALHQPLSVIDRLLISILQKKIETVEPEIVIISIPFPGNVFGTFRIGQWLKQYKPHIKIVIGGGYVNTELRSINDIRVFKYLDFITLDDGELPLKNIIKYLKGEKSIETLVRTFLIQNNKLAYINDINQTDIRQADVGVPDYSDLPLDKYLSILEMANPMFRLWSDGKWLKLTLAHGCYWAKCAFCDGSLDYIGRYEPNQINNIVDRIEALIKQTGLNSFHFVDEAAPPALLRELALELIRRRLNIIWWTNIRFEKNFTSDLCRLLKKSGCVAVSGGLEVASDRILKLINKGVDLAQVSRVCAHFKEAGIMIHAYLMYGFPTQTAQETIDSLEVVRQLFDLELLNSAFWHQFAMTAHSDVGLNPEKYKVEITAGLNGSFANNDLQHFDAKGAQHELFGDGLKKALYNYMHGICFDFQLNEWFDFKVPRTSLPSNYLLSFLKNEEQEEKDFRMVWLENIPVVEYYQKKKQQKMVPMASLIFNSKSNHHKLNLKSKLAAWLEQRLIEIADTEKNIRLSNFKESYLENDLGNFEIFMGSYSFKQLQKIGLVLI